MKAFSCLHMALALAAVSESDAGLAGSVFDAALWSFVAMVPVLISAWVGLKFSPGKRITSLLLALSSGLLIALLSYDLVDVAFRLGGIAPSLGGFAMGIIVYIVANRVISEGGIGRRNSRDCGGLGDLSEDQLSERNASIALVIGAALDGIPESMSIGISFLDNTLVSASVVLAVAVANIPEGLASGVGLKRSGFSEKKVLLIWSAVVLACVVASTIAYIAMSDVSLSAKAALTAFAGGGVLAMTFNTIVPEAYEETHDSISILGGIGFAIAFVVSHIFSH